jgi:uncharacterized membrane protein
MERRPRTGLAARWSPILGSVLGLAGCLACAFVLGWVLARYRDRPWAGSLVAWGLGLALAAAVARAAPRAWVDQWLAPRERRTTAAVLLTGFFVVEAAMAWLGYLTFHHYSYDLNLFVVLVQETFRGRFLHWVPWDPHRTHLYLAHHWALQTLVWLPAWKAWPDPRTLYLIQIGGYVAMAAAVHRLAVAKLGPGPWPLAILTAVLLTPAKDWALSDEMGNAPFLACLVVVAVLFVHRRRPVAFALTLVLILMSREDASFFAGALALYAWWTAGWTRLGAAALLVSSVWTVWLLKVLMPSLSAASESRPLWGSYRWLGDSPSQMLGNALGTPVALRHLVYVSLPSLLRTCAPFGALPLIASPAWVLILGLLPALLTSSGYVGALTYHHSYPAAAVAAVIAIEAARIVDGRLRPRPRLRLAAVLGVPLAALLLHVTLGYSPLTPTFSWSDYRSTPHTRAVWTALGLIPSGVAVAGSARLTVHRNVDRLPGCAWEHVSLRTVDGSPTLWCDDWSRPLDEPFLLIRRLRSSDELRNLVTASPYAVIFHQQDVALFQRGGDRSGNRELARWALGEARQAVHTSRQIGLVLPDEKATHGRAVRAPRNAAGFVQYGLKAWACPGAHELVVRLRGGPRAKAGPVGSLEIVADQGMRVLARRELGDDALDPADYRELAVSVTLAEPGWIEARIHSTGAAAFWVDALTLFAVTPSGEVRPPSEGCGRPPEASGALEPGRRGRPRASSSAPDAERPPKPRPQP